MPEVSNIVRGNISQHEHVSDHERMTDVAKKDRNMNYLL
jgi:hypothetical protein